MKNLRKFSVVALIAFFCGLFLAGNEAKAQVIEVGGSVGLSYYMGDINPKKPFSQSKLGWGVIVRYYNGTRWAFRLAYSNLQIAGSDEASGYNTERGLSFTNNIHDIALLAEFNFLDYFTGSKRHGLTPYLVGGISVLKFNPKAEDGTELCNVHTDVDYSGTMTYDGEKKYNTFALSIPFGLGVKYSVSQHIGLACEWRWHLALTDWLDDCHGYYPTYEHDSQGNLPTWLPYADPTGYTADINGENHMKFIQRGNPTDLDWYGYLNLTLTYKFNIPQGKNCNIRGKYKNFD